MDNAATTDTPVVNLHFLDYWRVIRLRKSLILTVFLLCVITSSILTYCLPKQYSSTVRIEVQKDTPEVNVRGMLLTLKLFEWKLAGTLPEYVERVLNWGFNIVHARQLQHNRQEVCVAALKKPFIRK